MLIDPEKVSTNELYGYMTRLIVPRPIAWVSTRSTRGVDNLAPFSYFNAVGTCPPTLVFCPANKADGSKKDTLLNIESTGQFVVNLVSMELVQAMNQSSAEYLPEESEFEACGLTACEAERIQVARVQQARAAFECQLHSVVILGSGPGAANMVIGRVIAIHVQDECLDSQGWPVADKLDAVGRLGGTSYATVREPFDIPRPHSPR